MNIKKLVRSAKIPRYATAGAACFDIASIESGMIPARGARTFRTGLAFEVPDDQVMMVYSRSGHGFKHGVRLANVVGIIDSDFRGEVVVRLHNDSDVQCMVTMGDRIAQAMLQPVERITFEAVENLGETDRGEGGFGSTGQ